MDIQSHAVAGAVAEVFAVAAALDMVARGDIHIGGGIARLDRAQRLEVRLQDGLIDHAHFIGGAADGNGTGHIAVVALVHRADIEGEEIALFDNAFAGYAVRQRGILACNADQIERDALAAVDLDQMLELDRDMTLGDAGLKDIEHLGIGALGDALSGDDLLDLGLCLTHSDPIQLGRQSVGEDSRDKRFLELMAARDRHGLVLDIHRLNLFFKKKAIQIVDQPSKAHHLQRRLYSTGRRLIIAEI